MLLGRGQREKHPTPRYQDKFIMPAKGKKGKSPQPKPDEIDSVYDYRGEEVCDIKFATKPERVELWVKVIEENYKCVPPQHLPRSKDIQIKLLATKWKGTIIELFQTGIIVVKGKACNFIPWAEQEFPALRSKLPSMEGSEGAEGKVSDDNDALGLLDSSLTIETTETFVKQLGWDQRECDRVSTREDTLERSIVVPEIHAQFKDPDVIEGTPVKSRPKSEGLPDNKSPKSPQERNRADIDMLKTVVSQIQSAVADIPIMKRMLVAQKSQREDEDKLRKQNDKMTKQISHLKNLLEKREGESFDNDLITQENSRLKKQVADLNEQIKRKEVEVSFLEEQVRQTSVQIKDTKVEQDGLEELKQSVEGNKNDIRDVHRNLQNLISTQSKDEVDSQFSILKGAIESNTSGIDKVYKEVKSLTEIQNATIGDIIKSAKEEDCLSSGTENIINPKVVRKSATHNRDDSLLVRNTTTNIVISDSMTRDVREVTIDPSEKTQVKSFGGLDSLQISNKLGAFKKNSSITEAILQVGANDKVNPLTEGNIQSLIKVAQEKFPNANITCSAVLPMRDGLTENSRKYNAALREVCECENVSFIDFGSDFSGKTHLYKDKIHLNDSGSEILTQKLQSVLLEREAIDRLVSEPRKIETVITGRVPSQSVPSQSASHQGDDQVHANNDKSYIATRLVRVTGYNEFQAFAARCSSHEEAMEIRHSIQHDTKWKYAPDGPLTSLMWAYSIDGVSRNDNDGETGAGPRIAKCMDVIGMDNCIVIVARKCGQHIQARRWSVMQDLISDAASKLGYNVPGSLDIHSMFREYGEQKRLLRNRRGPRFNGRDQSYSQGQSQDGSGRSQSQYGSGQAQYQRNTRRPQDSGTDQSYRQGQSHGSSQSQYQLGSDQAQYQRHTRRTQESGTESTQSSQDSPQHQQANSSQSQSQAQQVQGSGNDFSQFYYSYPGVPSGVHSGYQVPQSNAFMHFNPIGYSYRNVVPDLRMVHNWSPLENNLRQGHVYG